VPINHYCCVCERPKPEQNSSHPMRLHFKTRRELTSDTRSLAPLHNAIIESELRIISQSPIVLYVWTPHLKRYWQAAACPRAARKIGDVPKSPVPHISSPGAVGRHNDTSNRVWFASRCPSNARASEHRSRAPVSHRRQAMQVRAPQ